MTELHDLTAGEAARRLRDGAVSAADLLAACLERIRDLDGRLQAWETVDADGALATARASDAPGGLPLGGVPFAAKDIFDVRGLPTGAGSPIYRGRTAPDDSTVVARLRAAGTIPLGKTVTTEFAFLEPPRTLNPWNPAATPGGSSSGSAVAVAARMAPFALGSQTAGSTLRPAAYNGVVGFKPTHGRVSCAGVFPLAQTLDTVGIIARAVEDVAIVLHAVAGPDPADPLSASETVEDYVAAVSERGPTPPAIGVLRDGFFISRASGEVGARTQDVVDRLQEAGVRIVAVELDDDIEEAIQAHAAVMATEAAAVHRDTLAERADDYSDVMREFVERGGSILGADYVDARRRGLRFRDAVERLFDSCDVVLTPATPTAAPRSLSTTGDPSFQTPWTFAGVPAITLPTGLTEDGLPLGVQLIGGRFAESTLLGAAAWVEGVLDFRLEPDLARYVT